MNRRYILPIFGFFAALKAVTAQTPVGPVMTMTMRPNLEVFRTASQTYTLALLPVAGTREMVFVNGLLMCSGDDYVLQENTLTFTNQKILPDPVIHVQYWSVS